MFRLILLSLLLSAAVTSPVGADVAFPLAWHEKNADPVLRFEGVENCDGHVFYLHFWTSDRRDKVRRTSGLVEVKNLTGFSVPARNCRSLIAVERKFFDQRAKEDPSLQWLTEQTDGIQSVDLPVPTRVVWITESGTPVTVCRVSTVDGRLAVDEVASVGRSAKVIAGVFAAISLMLFGVWYARRRRAVAV